jgi:hypothetical protein
MADTKRRRLRFWVFPWIGAWLGIGGRVTSMLWTAHPTIGWIVGMAAGYFIGVSIMFFLEEWWGTLAPGAWDHAAQAGAKALARRGHIEVNMVSAAQANP